MNSNYNIDEINKEFWDMCEDFKLQINTNVDYIEYISALLYIIYKDKDNIKTLEKIYNSRNDFYIGEELDILLEKIITDNRNIFTNIKFKEIKGYRSIGKKSILSRFIERLYTLIMHLQNKYGESIKYIAKAYNYVLIQNLLNNSSWYRVGEIYTPMEISKIMINCLNIKDDGVVINDPYCGTGNMLINVPNYKNIILCGREENINTYNICMTNLLLNEKSNKCIKLADYENIDNIKEKYDYIISNPPFTERNIKIRELHNLKTLYYSDKEMELAPGDYSYVLSMFETLKNDGKMAVILPHGVLFRENEKRARKYLVENNYIDAIIGLPENIFFGTRISVIIMILNKNKQTRDILYIDASKEYKNKRRINILKDDKNKIINTYRERKEISEYSHIAQLDEIIENDYNLTIKKYIKKEIKRIKIDNEELINNIHNLSKEALILEDNIKDVLKLLYKDNESSKNNATTNKEDIYYLENNGILYARGKPINNHFIILKGSKVIPEKSESLSKGLEKSFERIRNSEYIVNGEFVKDYMCNSPSEAARIILGRNSNGLREWKNIHKEPLSKKMKE